MLNPVCCVECKKVFSKKGIHTHYIRMHTTESKRQSGKGTNKFQRVCSCVECKKQLSVQNLQSHLNKHTRESEKQPTICPGCGEAHTKSGTCCSRKCANRIKAKPMSDEQKRKISETLKSRPKQPNKPKTYCKVSFCRICSKPFEGYRRCCSSECVREALSAAGRKAAAKNVKRSKDEIELYNKCLTIFKNVEHNKPIFNGWDADIIIHDIKLAVLWNGPWHYREMGFGTHSLAQVANRDEIKIREIQSCGWSCVVFEDRYFTPEEAMTILNTFT